MRCQRKEPCRLFSVRKNPSRPSADEVSTSSLCQCPHRRKCPKHHLDVGVIPGKVYSDDSVRTYSGYCMWNAQTNKIIFIAFFYPENYFENQIKTAYQQFLFFLITVFRFIKSNETNLSPLHSDGFSLNEGHLQLDFTGFNWITLEAELAEQSWNLIF